MSKKKLSCYYIDIPDKWWSTIGSWKSSVKIVHKKKSALKILRKYKVNNSKLHQFSVTRSGKRKCKSWTYNYDKL